MRMSDLSRGEIALLEEGFRGTVVLPSDRGYHESRQLSNRAFQFFPQLIAYCEVFSDVRKSLQFAQAMGLEVAVRSGGHCTAGFSANNGMVIDVGRLSYVQVDVAKRRAVVGGGTPLGHLNASLAEYSLHVPGGCCSTVAVAGHMQGGGYGFTSREFGLHLDSVVELQLMTADGHLLTASEAENSDLFWAVRGGGGGHFGITLQITYALHPLGDLWGFGLQWPLDKAPAVLHALQSGFMTSGAPRQLGYVAVLCHQAGKPCLLMRGMFNGPRDEALAALAPLFALDAELEFEQVGGYARLNSQVIGHSGPLPPVPDLARQEKQSALVDRVLSLADWASIVEAYARTPTPWNLLAIEPYGGRIADVPVDATAFIHRQAAMNMFFDAFWMNDAQQTQAIDYLDEVMGVIARYANGHQYQNYPRRGSKGHAWAYWGPAYERLRAVKSRYDPHDFFRLPHGVEPLPAAPGNMAADVTALHANAAAAAARQESVA